MERDLLSLLAMRHSRRATWALAGAIACLPEALRADQTGIGLDVGIGSAVGLAGVTVTRSIHDVLRIEIGGGFGYTGWQFSVMPKVALGPGPWRFIAGVGLSVAFPTDLTSTTGHPIWLNADLLGAEYMSSFGLALSASLGLAVGLGGGRNCFPPDGCLPNDLEDVAGLAFPQARAGIAYWL